MFCLLSIYISGFFPFINLNICAVIWAGLQRGVFFPVMKVVLMKSRNTVEALGSGLHPNRDLFSGEAVQPIGRYGGLSLA